MCGNNLAGSAKGLLSLSHSCRGKAQGINLNQSEVRQSSTLRYVNPAASLKHKREAHWTPATLLQTIALMERLHGNVAAWRKSCLLDIPMENSLTGWFARVRCQGSEGETNSRLKTDTSDKRSNASLGLQNKSIITFYRQGRIFVQLQFITSFMFQL